MEDNKSPRTFTIDDLHKAVSAIKAPSFSSMSLGDQYTTYAQAAAAAGEGKSSDDSVRLSAFVDTMQSLLSASGLNWGGTVYGLVYTNTNWWVTRGDVDPLCMATTQINGRMYVCATIPPK